MRMEGLRERTKRFALRILKLHAALPRSVAAQTIGKQLLRSGTSVAANFREASRARSNAEFVAKIGVIEQELDESALWLELLVGGGFVPEIKLAELRKEADELIRIMIAAAKATKRKR